MREREAAVLVVGAGHIHCAFHPQPEPTKPLPSSAFPPRLSALDQLPCTLSLAPPCLHELDTEDRRVLRCPETPFLFQFCLVPAPDTRSLGPSHPRASQPRVAEPRATPVPTSPYPLPAKGWGSKTTRKSRKSLQQVCFRDPDILP